LNSRAIANPFSVLPVLIALIVNVIGFAPVASLGARPLLALAGTTFDATDGNLVVDAAETDWCSGQPVTRKDDLPTGQTDDSYAEGAKENDLNPAVEFGSIPNNKVDLDRVYMSSETSATGDLFVFLGWVRTDTTGTGTISFELNQSEVLLSNGVNHQRTVGDLLIEFSFQANPGSVGGYTVTLTYRVWDGDSWGNAISLAGFAEGSVNAGPIIDCLNSNQALGTGQFGEFALNLTDLLGGDCRAFVSLFAKSRASNTITSALKELVKPADVDLSTCAQITWHKTDQFDEPLGGATFSVTPDPFDPAHLGSLSVLDNTGEAGYTGADEDPTAGEFLLTGVEPYTANGGYTICETAAPSDDYVADDTCITLEVPANSSIDFGTFVNELLSPVLPDVTVEKAGNGTISAGDTASFTVTIRNLGPGTAFDVHIDDLLPPGGWTIGDLELFGFGLVDPDAGCAGSVEVGEDETFSCDISEMPEGSWATVEASRETAAEDCGRLHNEVAISASNEDPDAGDNNQAEDDVLVECPGPTLVIDKVASVEEITISGPANAQTADPSVVTWTLTYTLTNGPVTNAVITDEVPTGFIFLDASDDGQLVDGVVTWTFLELTESGNVTFRTTVDVATISRTDPTVNVAVIVSDQTPEDEGEDEVSVVVEPPVLGGTPPQVPDTALTIGPAGDPITIPVELMAALLLTSLGALAYANVRVVRRRG